MPEVVDTSAAVNAGGQEPRTTVNPINELRQWTPEQLAVRAAEGCLASFGELVNQFQGRLYNFLLRRVSSASEAEDLAQEAFVRAWERIKSYDPRWRFSTWLFTIASRLAVSRHRSESRARPHERRLARERPSHDEGEVDRRISAGEQFDRLWSIAEEKLSHEQRTALWLRYAEGLSIAEIATILTRSHVGVRVMLFRIRQTLIQHLSIDDASPDMGGGVESSGERVPRTNESTLSARATSLGGWAGALTVGRGKTAGGVR